MSKYTTLVLDEEQKARLIKVLEGTIGICSAIIDGRIDGSVAEINEAELHDEAQELLEDIQA